MNERGPHAMHVLLLHPDNKEFIYRNCIALQSSSGSTYLENLVLFVLDYGGFVNMVAEGTKRPQVSLAILPPPRKINVQKYAESRALELQSLQSIIENRGLEKDQLKKLHRRVRRRYELKKNLENGFCTSGDGTKRLRTHVWHAKRFAMTKLWGYHLPLCVQGRGKGSRALLKRLKQGVLIHDASYYTAIQLEGPEDSLMSVLRLVLEPPPATITYPGNHDDSVLSSVTYGSAMKTNSLPNPCPESFKISNSDSMSNSFGGTVVRTGCKLTTFLNETKAGQLLLFSYAADGEARISKFINGELKFDPSSERSEDGLQMSQSAIRLYFKEHSSGRWEMQIPEDSISSKSHRCSIGFVTTASQQQQHDGMQVPHGPEPMEAVQAESTNTVTVPTVDDTPSAKFTWTIDNFSSLPKRVFSDVFSVGGFKWRILIFSKGNSVDYLSMYVDVADADRLPYGWSKFAQFSLTSSVIANTITFNAHECDWGFINFMPLAQLYDSARGYLVNDKCIVEADIAVRKDLDWSYDSKKETGYAVYHMPTSENDMPSASIPLALQSLFYKLQFSDTSVATKELTKSFGWDSYDSFMQHDVQELNRVLCEKLEDKMRGTVVEGTIQKLFEGHHMNYIECINEDYKSTRKESFYDLQLDVKGCKDVYASFDKYIEVERLEGDNKYHAEHHGLQDARKGVLFIDFPPVLQLQLKRFEYDFTQDTMVKINDRYEFPLQLDLDRDNGKYLSPEADRSIRNLYSLHSGENRMVESGVQLTCTLPHNVCHVLVHSSGVKGGHYYAYIRPTLSNQWFKFDDERVTKEDAKMALEEQYGCEEELPHTNPGFNSSSFKFTKYSNAYMLVYVRESDKDKIICNVDEKDIPEHLRVARDEDMREQIGNKIFFDLVDHDKEEVAKELGIPIQYQRFWLWAKRQNSTYRPNRPLTPQEEAQSMLVLDNKHVPDMPNVGLLREVSNRANNAEMNLFLELEMEKDLRPIPPPEKSKENLLLFFKLYEPSNEKLWYVGRLFVMCSGKPADILVKLNEMAGYAPDEEIDLFEEIKFEPSVMCEPVDKKSTFRDSQLEDGDIICFQKSHHTGTREPYRYPDVPSFLEYVHNRLVVRFRILEKPKEDEFSLELSKLDTYDNVVEEVAQHIGLNDPCKIRLTCHNCYSQQPKPQPIKYRGMEHLSDMLIHYNQTSDILYYEVLDIPLPELQCLKTLKITFHHATKDEVVTHTIRLPKHSIVSDVINDLKSKVDLSHPDAELRLLEVFYHKIYKVFHFNEKIENINDQYWMLRVEEELVKRDVMVNRIPEEEKNLGPHHRLIHVYHFLRDTAQKQQVQNFGHPFFLVIHESETLAEVKLRIQRKLQVPDEEFSKWRFAFLSFGRPEYLEDSDIVYTRFQRRDIYGAWEQYLGLEHTDNAPKRSSPANQKVGFDIPFPFGTQHFGVGFCIEVRRREDGKCLMLLLERSGVNFPLCLSSP
ncbi:unnamed protein product [Sphenostylis stenocarpa]|uniref:ubiquitinyl hydrolase 1 n=1 Tax=Sphenostylis stenocarpa TaxID=92480 RepID=A0AA86SNM4_9FABA|nr:unnamed protein product [Sphenostylis stenocarpa]